MSLFLRYLREQPLYGALCASLEHAEGNLLEQVGDAEAEAHIEIIRWWFRLARPRAILETGTNKALFGYLCSQILPEPATLWTFDLRAEASRPVEILNAGQDILSAYFMPGDSKVTLAQWNAPTPIDVAWIDGGHDEATALSDLVNAARLGAGWIGFDDTAFHPNLLDVTARFMGDHPYRIVQIPPLLAQPDASGALVLQRRP